MTIYVFDMDGTLTPPRLPMTNEFSRLFKEWQKRHSSFIATGSDFKKVREQLPQEVIDLFTGVYCSMGNMLYAREQILYQNEFDYPEGLIELLVKFRNSTHYPGKLFDNVIEHRIGMINFSILGRNCPYAERERYSCWDNIAGERRNIQAILQQKFPELEITVGGSISIDITPKGYGKGQIAKRLRADYPTEEIIFFGDRTYPGGNDYELACELLKLEKTKVVQVDGPAEVLDRLSFFERSESK